MLHLSLMGAALLAISSPGDQALMCALAALVGAFLSASQDVVVDALAWEMYVGATTFASVPGLALLY